MCSKVGDRSRAEPGSDQRGVKSMAGNPKQPQIGELSIDASALSPFLVDLPAGALQGMRTEQDGFDDVVKEIVANQADWGDVAGVTQADLDQLLGANTKIDQIDVFLPAARKLVEMLEESRGKQDDLRQRQVGAIAKSAESRAKTGNPDLLAKYEK